MRVVLIHQAFVAPDEAGGTRHYELAKRAVESGIQFTVVASDISYLTGQRAIAVEQGITEQNFDGVRVLRAYTYASLHRSFAWRVVSFLSFMLTSIRVAWRAGRVDLVMGTSPPIFQAVSAWLVALVRRRPLLLRRQAEQNQSALRTTGFDRFRFRAIATSLPAAIGPAAPRKLQ